MIERTRGFLLGEACVNARAALREWNNEVVRLTTAKIKLMTATTGNDLDAVAAARDEVAITREAMVIVMERLRLVLNVSDG